MRTFSKGGFYSNVSGERRYCYFNSSIFFGNVRNFTNVMSQDFIIMFAGALGGHIEFL